MVAVWAELEGLAGAFLGDAGIGAPVDPWLVAWSLELEVVTGPPGLGTYLCEDTIFVDPLEREERQGFGVIHECAHELLRGAGLPSTEALTNGLTSCVLLPRIDFMRDVRSTGRDLYALRGLHPWASHEAIARRIVSIAPAIAWVWDRTAPRRRRYSIVTPGQRWHRREPLPVELDAMTAALECGEPVEAVGGVRAWPVREPGFERVICVSDLDVLAAYV